MSWTGQGTTAAAAASATYAALDDLVLQVKQDAPGLEDNAALDALRRAARELCELTGVLTETITITTVEDQAGYTLAPATAGCEVLEVESLKLDGALSDVPAGDYDFDPAAGTLVWKAGRVPSEAGLEYAARVTLRPQRWAAVWPAWLLARYGDAVAAGACARLLEEPGRPWSNPALAAMRRREFMAAVSGGKAEKLAGWTGRSNSMRP